MTDTSLNFLQDGIVRQLERGARFGDVEAWLAEATPPWLGVEERDALWLYAWAYRGTNAPGAAN